MATDPLEVPDYQYEMLESIIGAGWEKAFPRWIDPPADMTPEEFLQSTDAWLAVMENASLEMAKRGWVLAKKVREPA